MAPDLVEGEANARYQAAAALALRVLAVEEATARETEGVVVATVVDTVTEAVKVQGGAVRVAAAAAAPGWEVAAAARAEEQVTDFLAAVAGEGMAQGPPGKVEGVVKVEGIGEDAAAVVTEAVSQEMEAATAVENKSLGHLQEVWLSQRQEPLQMRS